MSMIRIGTCITENYNASRYLESLNRFGDNPFCVTYGFHATEGLRNLYSRVEFFPLEMPQPADCDRIIQYGAWLRAIPGNDAAVYILTDADGRLQRELTEEERFRLVVIGPGAAAIGYNGGPDDDLLQEWTRLSEVAPTATAVEFASVYPGFEAVPCYNGGLIAARRPFWEAMATMYESQWPRFDPMCVYRARCQWLLCWCMHMLKTPVTVLPRSVHAHGHFGIPAGTERRGETWFAGNEPIFFAHRL